MSESRKSGKIRNRSQLKSSVQMLQQWNAEYRERITELEALNKDIREDYQQDMKDYGIHKMKALITELREIAEKWRSTTGLFIKDPDTRATTVKAFRICADELEAAIGEQSDE